MCFPCLLIFVNQIAGSNWNGNNCTAPAGEKRVPNVCCSSTSFIILVFFS